MKIIDAHLHFCPGDAYFDGIAEKAGHFNTAAHLMEKYESLGIAAGIVMGNRGLDPRQHTYPGCLRYCAGLDSAFLMHPCPDEALALLEENLKRPSCAGIKLYPGYHPFYVTDPIYDPVYALAEKYGKAVAIHTGATAGSNALLKYSHPLTLDEAAVRHPYTQFIMCHFGNPWLNDAAAVAGKNSNVAVDLSGLLEGAPDLGTLFAEQAGYLSLLRTWLSYLGFGRVMFGTDWPLVNLDCYRDFILRIVPEAHYEEVFFSNANRIYKLGL